MNVFVKPYFDMTMGHDICTTILIILVDVKLGVTKSKSKASCMTSFIGSWFYHNTIFDHHQLVVFG